MNKCNCCGEENYETQFHPSGITKHMQEKGVCFSCGFWYEKLDLAVDGKVVIVNGHHYRDNGFLKERTHFMGHGGHIFKYIKDGKEHVTNNLWSQGEIPQHFRHLLPDNAVWIKEEPIMQKLVKDMGLQ